ncbi:hypothetical protein HMPREF3038_02605 [Akkermansia sp. KLE1797]|nr:hypothetical protein HMPREF3038_02605 [Akkermansia sp. KLE1797]KXU52977.1 hypothetical protein HMPREF3039_02846 [Akkermansia sp. KLE1798]KZA03617.1 hypothetical protein HMPREF1326_02705 [Akkermansia sp. KLE1605]
MLKPCIYSFYVVFASFPNVIGQIRLHWACCVFHAGLYNLIF